MPSPRVLFIGLDACSAEVMLGLAAAGRAPVVAGLLEHGAHAATSPPVGLFEGALWPSLFTGCSPARHGYYCHEALDVGSYTHRNTSPRELAETPFWETLSQAGRRVAVIDMPHSVATQPVNGVQIVEWGCHDRHVGFHTWPASLAHDVESQFGLHPVGGLDADRSRQFAPCDYSHRAHGARRTHAEARALQADLLAGVDRKTDLSLQLLDREDWDVFATVFGEAHCAGHQFWHLHDRHHPAHDPDLAAEIGDPVEQVYTRLDAAIGAHLERAGPDTTVFVLLSHGMGSMNTGVFLIDVVLARLASAAAARSRGNARMRAAKRTWHALPIGVRRRLAPLVARMVRRRLRDTPGGPMAYHEVFDRCPGCSGIVPSDDTVMPWFVVPNNTVCGGIRINLAGREPHGVVRPGEDFDRVCAQLATDLLDVVKVESGEPLIRAVTRTADHYDRSPGDPFPDLFIEWDRRSPVKTVYSPKVGVVHEPYDHWRTGDHFAEGLLLATGPGMPRGAVPTIAITDIAPTMCERVGVELAGIDGASRADLSSAPEPADAR